MVTWTQRILNKHVFQETGITAAVSVEEGKYFNRPSINHTYTKPRKFYLYFSASLHFTLLAPSIKSIIKSSAESLNNKPITNSSAKRLIVLRGWKN
jgi:hypothetical protein